MLAVRTKSNRMSKVAQILMSARLANTSFPPQLIGQDWVPCRLKSWSWTSRPAPPAIVAAYAEGRTGFPFVDACMRQLRATGWIIDGLPADGARPNDRLPVALIQR